jgi:hypothetical protein
MYITGITAGMTSGFARITAGGKDFDECNYNYYAIAAGVSIDLGFSVMASMAAADTAVVSVAIYGGSKVVDILGGAGNYSTRFQGSLLC